ncbi:MAG TPA: site-specific integrase [Crenalkalicoccus sp.]|jgi:integrase|nr:site-specific integrase [Crenalkalicoccus sp.]
MPEPPSPARPPATPLPANPHAVRGWFEAAAELTLPVADGGGLETARTAALAFARAAKAANTRRAYRAGVRAWCDWCDRHGLPALPARGDDVAAYLAAARVAGRAPATIEVHRAAIRYLHHLARLPVPTGDAAVGETLAGIRRTAAAAGLAPAKKGAATAEVLRAILAAIPGDLRGLRDRALLVVGFAGALRRAELAAIRIEHLEPTPRGLRLTLPVSKGERSGKAVTIPLPYGEHGLCPVRAIAAWCEAAGIHDGALFRRLWVPRAARGDSPPPPPRLGAAAIDPRTVARVVQARATAAGYPPGALGGHSLKRGALTTGMDRGVHPARLKRLGRHRSYAVLDEYLEHGDPFDGHPLAGVL